MTVVGSYGMVLCGNSDELSHRYRGRIEKVKFGVPINEAFAHDIPATLLVLLLKVNKEGPLKKDIWRAPGNQAQVRKLSHIMQHGRLVNIANFSVYTAASVIKKFLSKLPGGIFGVENEQQLFNSALANSDVDKQRHVFYRIFCSLPVPSQHLLVLLFGTFRMVADSADTFGTKMTPDAIAISVAPSLFHSCIHDGRQVKFEDVQRFKLASQVVSSIITSFGHTNLFPRECYEFYARITGRTLRVDENWLFSFQYPSRSLSQPEVTVSPVAEVDEDDQPECSYAKKSAKLPERKPSRMVQRLSSSVAEGLHDTSDVDDAACELEALRPLTACAGESSTSLHYLQWVHENQSRRMKSRSEWFLSPLLPTKGTSKSVDFNMYAQGLSLSLKSTPSPIPERKETPPKLLERKESTNSRKHVLAERQPSVPSAPSTPRALQDLSRRSTPVNLSGWCGNPAGPNGAGNGSTPGSASSVAVTRRRSWRTNYVRPGVEEGTPKTHSLDSPEASRAGGKSVSGVTHSLGGETWLNEVVTDEVPKKRRSLKKKQSTQF